MINVNNPNVRKIRGRAKKFNNPPKSKLITLYVAATTTAVVKPLMRMVGINDDTAKMLMLSNSMFQSMFTRLVRLLDL